MRELPPDYHTLVSLDCEDLKIADSLCDPVILIENIEGTPAAFLSGNIFTKGTHLYPKALSLKHTWIDDGRFIRPLPSDTPEMVDKLFYGLNPASLTFPQILNLRTKVENLQIGRAHV